MQIYKFLYVFFNQKKGIILFIIILNNRYLRLLNKLHIETDLKHVYYTLINELMRICLSIRFRESVYKLTPISVQILIIFDQQLSLYEII